MNSYEKLLFLNQELFTMIENSISIDLLARLLSTQLVTRGEKSLLDRSRLYYRLLSKIILEGQTSGELRTDISVGEIVKAYAICERAFMYDWCISGGEHCAATLRECCRSFYQIFGHRETNEEFDSMLFCIFKAMYLKKYNMV